MVAVDRVGQSTASKTRILRVDWKPPTLRVKLSRLGSVLRVTVRTTDATGKRAKSSGLAGKPRIDFGDGAKVTGLRASHSYRRAGAVTLRVTSADRAGNVAVYRKRLHIR